MPLVLSLAALAWLSLAEWKIFERLLFDRPADYEFVIKNVHGILAGTPVFKATQQRVLGPLAVVGLEKLTGDPVSALKLWISLMLGAANLLLFALLRRAGVDGWRALAAVVGLGFAHIVTSYTLEYPWDGIDVLLFLTFGWWVARGGGIAASIPLFAIGAFNHESVLYMPLWFLLAPLDGEAPSLPGPRSRLTAQGRAKKQLAGAFAALVILAAVILFVRAKLCATPDLPAQEIHVLHNARNLLAGNWTAGRAHLSAGVLSAIALLGWLALKRPPLRRAAVWSLCAIGAIGCFGYTNETRLYLPLIAFWIPYIHVRKRPEPSSSA